MDDFIFELGCTVKDMITGFKGIVRGRTQYMTGCNCYAVQNIKLGTDGQPQEWKWYDEGQLQQVGKKIVSLQEEGKKDRSRGGPVSKDQYPK